jgi:hypothetical protein
MTVQIERAAQIGLPEMPAKNGAAEIAFRNHLFSA